MLPIKLERAIFIIVFGICFLTCIFFAMPIKAYELPINRELTPEQIIESEYKNLSYEYIIENNFMFVCVETKTGYCILSYAFRNSKSGFMFGVTGLSIGNIFNHKMKYISIEDENPLVLSIVTFDNNYYISIEDPFEKRNIKVLCDGIEMRRITFDDVKNQYWVGEIGELSEFKEIKGIYNEEIIYIIDTNEIKLLFGEVSQ